MKPNQKIPLKKSPCIGRCSTVYGDTVCRGCYRFAEEIVHWNHFNIDNKVIIWQRIENCITTIMEPKISYLNPERLQQQLAEHKIRFYQSLNPYCWIYGLIITLQHPTIAHHKQLSLTDFEFKFSHNLQSKSLQITYDQIIKETHQLALAYQDRTRVDRFNTVTTTTQSD